MRFVTEGNEKVKAPAPNPLPRELLPLFSLTALVELHLEGGGTGAGKHGGVMAAVLIVVWRLHGPGSQHHWLLGLTPAFLLHLAGTR